MGVKVYYHLLSTAAAPAIQNGAGEVAVAVAVATRLFFSF